MDATRISIFDAVRAIQSPSIRDGQDRIGANVAIPTGDVQQRQALAAEARSLAQPTELFCTICQPAYLNRYNAQGFCSLKSFPFLL